VKNNKLLLPSNLQGEIIRELYLDFDSSVIYYDLCATIDKCNPTRLIIANEYYPDYVWMEIPLDVKDNKEIRLQRSTEYLLNQFD